MVRMFDLCQKITDLSVSRLKSRTLSLIQRRKLLYYPRLRWKSVRQKYITTLKICASKTKSNILKSVFVFYDRENTIPPISLLQILSPSFSAEYNFLFARQISLISLYAQNKFPSVSESTSFHYTKRKKEKKKLCRNPFESHFQLTTPIFFVKIPRNTRTF